MTETSENYMFGNGSIIAWIFIFLLILGGFALVASKNEHKENRDRNMDVFKAASDSEKQALRDYAAQQNTIIQQGVQTREAITAAANANALAQSNAAYQTLQNKYWETLLANSNTINRQNTQIDVGASTATIMNELSKKANAPTVAAVSACCPPSACISGSCSGYGTL